MGQKAYSNRESRCFVTEGVDGRMAEYIQTNTQGLHGSVVHATVKEYLKILNYVNYSNYYSIHTSAVSGFRSIFNALSMLFNAVMVLYFGDKLCKVFWFPDRKK